jgi:hypothetical protein
MLIYHYQAGHPKLFSFSMVFFLDRAGNLAGMLVVSLLVLADSSGLVALRSVRGLLSAGSEDIALGSLRGMSTLFCGAASQLSDAEAGGGGSVGTS